MDKKYAKYMTYGKMVKSSWTEEVYKLIENMDEKRDTVLAVELNNLRRYDILSAWIHNYDSNYFNFREKHTAENVEEWKDEKKSYEIELRVQDVTPNDKIRFIAPDYTLRFEVENLGRIKENGKVKKVYHIDGYHFGFVGGSIFHICEYAEICKKNGITVEPLK